MDLINNNIKPPKTAVGIKVFLKKPTFLLMILDTIKIIANNAS
jgi:hypothetical protein